GFRPPGLAYSVASPPRDQRRGHGWEGVRAMRMLKRFCLTLAGAAAALALAPAGARAAACDRACLEGVMNAYLDAMVAHDPTKAPFAPDARFTENAVV